MTRIVTAPALVYQMLRTKPEGTVTLNNADERMDQCLQIHEPFVASKSMHKQLIELDDGSKELIQVPVDNILSGYHTATAYLKQGPEKYDSKIGVKHEVEVQLPTAQWDILKQIASKMGTALDNKFLCHWMLGNALCQWLDRDDKIEARETDSLLPAGEYVFNLDIWNLVDYTLSCSSPSSGLVKVRDENFLLQPDQKHYMWSRRIEVKVLVVSSKSSGKEKSVDEVRPKGKKVKQHEQQAQSPSL